MTRRSGLLVTATAAIALVLIAVLWVQLRSARTTASDLASKKRAYCSSVARMIEHTAKGLRSPTRSRPLPFENLLLSTYYCAPRDTDWFEQQLVGASDAELDGRLDDMKQALLQIAKKLREI